VAVSEAEHEHGDEHQVTPLGLFFDLVFVFAITQVTRLLANDPTWGEVFRGDARPRGPLVGVERLRVADQRSTRWGASTPVAAFTERLTTMCPTPP
jgi:Bacterial low temperature requirement A protein (LtrA)